MTKAWLAALALAVAVEAAARRPRVEANSVETASYKGAKFSIEQVANDGRVQRDALVDFAMAHAKYGKEPPDGVARALRLDPALKGKFAQQDDATGTVPATSPPVYDTEYVIPMQVGTPPQTLNVNLDTGSADLWVFSTDTQTSSVRNQTLYRPGSSSTSSPLDGHSWKIKYGDDSSASGVVYTDRVQVGRTHYDAQAVESAEHVSVEIAGDSFSSGILGLAHGAANTVKPSRQATYLENIAGDLELPLFTANLRRQRPGNYNFGYIDAGEYEGEIAYASTNESSPFWELVLDGYQVGTGGSYKAAPWRAIVDTGTSLLLAPSSMAAAYWSRVAGAGIDAEKGMYTFPCGRALPDFYTALGSYRGLVPGAYMNYGAINATTCYGGLQSSDKIGFAVLGDVLLKAQFVVFDQGQRLVGFANKALDVAADDETR